MNNKIVYIIICLSVVIQGCKEVPNRDLVKATYDEIIDLNKCICQTATLKIDKHSFQVSDSIKIQTLRTELEALDTIKDDGRVIFGDTIIFNCKSDAQLMVFVNDDYIKLNNQKYKPNFKFRRKLRKYEGDAYVDKVIKKALSNIDSTTELSLRNCSLDSIPDEVFQLYNLERIDMALNIIEEIPDEISKLTKLKYLGLSYNLITKISPRISELQNIEKIWLLDNELQTIPNAICELRKLRELNITNNPLNRLPNCIPYMDSLNNFYFGPRLDKHSKEILNQIKEFKKVNKELNVRI